MSEIIQGSPEWFDLKRGKFSASRSVDLCKGARGAYTAARKNYIAKVVCEILTGKTAETYQSAAMERGVELEAEARTAYEAKSGAWVEQDAFKDHPTIPMFGSSPDGLIDPDGGLEIKCPEAAQHLATIRGAEIKRDYQYQIQSNMMVYGRKWWDYVSYNPEFPEYLQLYTWRIYPDLNIQTEIAYEVNKAAEEVAQIIKELTA